MQLLVLSIWYTTSNNISVLGLYWIKSIKRATKIYDIDDCAGNFCFRAWKCYITFPSNNIVFISSKSHRKFPLYLIHSRYMLYKMMRGRNSLYILFADFFNNIILPNLSRWESSQICCKRLPSLYSSPSFLSFKGSHPLLYMIYIETQY